jgi:4-hydroxythreonine-4-phosphate dehydrogenase
MTRRPRIAITLGDPCGIGPELLLSSLAAINRWAEVLVIGARAGIDLLDGSPAKVHWAWVDPAPVAGLNIGARTLHGLATQPLDPRQEGEGGYATWLDPTPEISPAQLHLGIGSAASGRCAVEAVRLGAELVQAGQADALVTLPLAKSAAHLAGYGIPGHTEFLADLAGTPITRMAFVSPTLSVVLHTVHQSLRSVVEDLSVDAVAETLAFAADRFIQLTGNLNLKVGLAAMNPHGGENGAFGLEEAILDEALVQAEAQFLAFDGDAPSPFAHVPSPFPPGAAPSGWGLYPARNEGLALMGCRRDIEIVDQGRPRPALRPAPQFFGPLPADTLFLRAARGEFDLVVALFHDQGLIPLKVLEPDRAVNLTLGLPYIRTSPDHGTAFDRAGKWNSSAVNFMEATALAVRLAGRAKQEPWDAQASGPK